MEEGAYLFIAQHIIGSAGFFLRFGLERKLDGNYKKAKEEYRR